MKPSRRTVLVASIAGALVLAGCSGGGSSSASDATHQISIAVVPGPDIGIMYVPEVEKIFASHDIGLTITEVAGQDVVDEVVAGTYDIGYAAFVPPILALADGADIRLINGLSTHGPDGHNGATMVKSDSGIVTWADLAGKTVATPSDKSLSALTLEAAVKRDSGDDAASVTISQIEHGKVAAAVEKGDVDAGDLVEPYASAALGNYDNLTNLGDSKFFVLGEGSPFTGFFATSSTVDTDLAAMEAFRVALDESIDWANANLDTVKRVGGAKAGLSEDVAMSLPNPTYDNTILTADDLQQLVDVMLEVGWLDTAPDLNAFVWIAD